MLLLPAPALTCGLIVRTPNGWLLGRATGLGYWDLPKGKRDLGETPMEAALRECREETGLDFSAWRDNLVDLGARNYHRKRSKTLQLFVLSLEQAVDLSTCACSTWVATRGPEPVLDMDAWDWVAETDIVRRVNRRMAKHLRKRGLIEATN